MFGPSHHFGKKRNLVAIGGIAGMDGPFACPHRSRLTLIDRLVRDFVATQHGQRAAILIFKCSIN
jgi:hypothetical protein